MEHMPDQHKSDLKSAPSEPEVSETQPPGWFVAAFFMFFLAWAWLYLSVLRPEMNHWLAQYMSAYPAMLHLIPIIGLPVFVAFCLGPLFSKPRRKP